MPRHAVIGLDDLNNKALGLQGLLWDAIECDMDFAVYSTGMLGFFAPNSGFTVQKIHFQSMRASEY